MKEIVDRHTKEIEDLKNKLALVGAGGGGGGGSGVDLDQLAGLFAGKNPPDNTLVRIEELERFNAEVIARVINHDKTLYQNSTLDDLVKNDSKNVVASKVNTALGRSDGFGTRAASANKANRENLDYGSGVSKKLQDIDAATSASQRNLEKVFDEIEALNNTDSCLTTRIQKLEAAIRANHKTVTVHTSEIAELKMNSNVKIEPIATDGNIDTSAIL